MMHIDTREITRFERDLIATRKSAVPFATRQAVNGQAFTARKAWQHGIRTGMVNRNAFTAGSVKVEQARSLDIRAQAATVGSEADYMGLQEEGGTIGKKGKEGHPIPTPFAAKQSQSAKPRTKAVVPSHWQTAIRLRNKSKVRGSRKRQNLVMIREAAKSGDDFVYLELRNNRKGIYKVLGSPRKPRIKLVWNLSHPVVRIPRNPTLAPAVKVGRDAGDRLYRDALEFQLRRFTSFGTRR